VHEVLLGPAAEKDLDRLPKTLFARIIKELNRLAENPRPGGSRKIVGSISDWRVRVGDYRIIYEISEDKKEVRVMRIKHRREAYR
jgi:mRNA interferase RelE/StbE